MLLLNMDLSGLDRIMKNKSTILAINALLGILLLLAALLFTRDLLSMTLSPKSMGAKWAKKDMNPVRLQLRDYASLMKNNPFGFSAGELKPLSASMGSSISQSDLALIGTIAGRKDRSYAIFLDKTGKQDLFKVGDNVLGLGTLKKVDKDNVVILSNGRDIKVPFSDITDVKEVKSGGPSASAFGKRTGESTYLLDQQRIQQALEKPDQLLTDARFIPNMIEGRQQGFVLRELKPGGIYASLGLQNGDVLLRINEYSISSPDTALQAITALKGIDRAQLDIIRNGSKTTMTYQIR
jgi:general secretion pathway protein C